MTTIVKLGNLQILDIEKELGIVFSDEDRQYLESTHQENISEDLQSSNWHFFDLPHIIEFGSYKAFDKFNNMLKRYRTDKSIQTGFYNEEIKFENLFDLLDEKSGLPRYLVKTSYKADYKFLDRDLLVLKRVNKKTAVYTIISPNSLERLYGDKLGYKDISILSDPYVPMEEVETYNEIKLNIDDIINRDKNGNILVKSEKDCFSDNIAKKRYTSYKVWEKSSAWTVLPREGSLSEFENMLEDNKKHLVSKKSEVIK